MGELNRLSKRDYVLSGYDMALVYIALVEKDRALAELERSYEEQSERLEFIRADWRLAERRSDPRFQDLVRRMNFPP
jgi:hypothetical protein